MRMDDEKIAERKNILTGIIKHMYPANSEIYFCDGGFDSEI